MYRWWWHFLIYGRFKASQTHIFLNSMISPLLYFWGWNLHCYVVGGSAGMAWPELSSRGSGGCWCWRDAGDLLWSDSASKNISEVTMLPVSYVWPGCSRHRQTSLPPDKHNRQTGQTSLVKHAISKLSFFIVILFFPLYNNTDCM